MGPVPVLQSQLPPLAKSHPRFGLPPTYRRKWRPRLRTTAALGFGFFLFYRPALASISPPAPLPIDVVPTIPACALTCLASFVNTNYLPSTCGSAPTLNCLCANLGAGGLTFGEAAVECLSAEVSIGYCSGVNVTVPILDAVHFICANQPLAIVPTNTQLIATFVIPSTGPGTVVFEAPSSWPSSSQPLPTSSTSSTLFNSTGFTGTSLPIPAASGTRVGPTSANGSSPSQFIAIGAGLGATAVVLLFGIFVAIQCRRRHRHRHASTSSGPNLQQLTASRKRVDSDGSDDDVSGASKFDSSPDANLPNRFSDQLYGRFSTNAYSHVSSYSEMASSRPPTLPADFAATQSKSGDYNARKNTIGMVGQDAPPEPTDRDRRPSGNPLAAQTAPSDMSAMYLPASVFVRPDPLQHPRRLADTTSRRYTAVSIAASSHSQPSPEGIRRPSLVTVPRRPSTASHMRRPSTSSVASRGFDPVVSNSPNTPTAAITRNRLPSLVQSKPALSLQIPSAPLPSSVASIFPSAAVAVARQRVAVAPVAIPGRGRPLDTQMANSNVWRPPHAVINRRPSTSGQGPAWKPHSSRAVAAELVNPNPTFLLPSTSRQPRNSLSYAVVQKRLQHGQPAANTGSPARAPNERSQIQTGEPAVVPDNAYRDFQADSFDGQPSPTLGVLQHPPLAVHSPPPLRPQQPPSPARSSVVLTNSFLASSPWLMQLLPDSESQWQMLTHWTASASKPPSERHHSTLSESSTASSVFALQQPASPSTLTPAPHSVSEPS